MKLNAIIATAAFVEINIGTLGKEQIQAGWKYVDTAQVKTESKIVLA